MNRFDWKLPGVHFYSKRKIRAKGICFLKGLKIFKLRVSEKSKMSINIILQICVKTVNEKEKIIKQKDLPKMMWISTNLVILVMVSCKPSTSADAFGAAADPHTSLCWRLWIVTLCGFHYYLRLTPAAD